MSIAEKIIEYRNSSAPIAYDDMSVLYSTIEYDQSGKELNYMLFDMLATDSSGEQKHFFKAIKLYRLLLTPKNDRIANFLMEKQAEVLSSMWEHRIHFLSLIANILDPAIGLVYTYGVQGVGDTVSEAKKDADLAFSSLGSSLQGTFRTIRFRPYNYEEAEWLRKKMIEMKHLSILKGIPYPHQNTSPASMSKTSTGGGSAKNDIRSQTETMEEFISGMVDHEYVMLTMANPIHEKVLKNWLQVLSREETKWASILQGASNVNFSLALPMMFGGNMGGGLGYNHATNHTAGQSSGHGTTWSDSVAQGASHGVTQGVNHGISATQGHGIANSNTTTHGSSVGSSHTISHSTTHTLTTGHTHGTSGGTSWNQGSSSNSSSSSSNSTGYAMGNTKGTSTGSSHGVNDGGSYTGTVGGSVSLKEKIPFIASAKQSISGSIARGHSWGWSNDHSTSTSSSNSLTQNYGSTTGHDSSNGTSSGYGGSSGWTDSVSGSNGTSHGTTIADGTTNTSSVSKTIGQTNSQSWSNGTTSGTSSGTSNTTSRTSSQGWGGNQSSSVSTSNGTGYGTNNAWSMANSASLGLAPGISIGKSYQWKDVEVENVLRLMDFQKERLMRSLNGQGAFFVDTMIATGDEEALHSAMSISKGAFYNKEAFVSPLQVLEMKEHRKDHLLYHFNCFSPCLERDGVSGTMDSYAYSSVLLADELTAYTHPPRMSFGGLYADVEDMPQFSVPSHRRNGDIYVGKVLSGQVWSQDQYRKFGNGHRTEFSFKIFNNELMHALFQGESRSGKTETAIRVVAEVSEMVRPTGKKPRILVFDQKTDWRKLYYVVDKNRFRFYQMDSFGQLGLKINVFKVAPNVHPEIHIKTLVESFVSAYGLGIMGTQIMKSGLMRLYNDKNCLGMDWEQKTYINSQNITFEELYEYIQEDQEQALQNGMRNMAESYQRVLVRLEDFAKKGSVLNYIFSQPDGLGIHELLGEDDITVIEAKLMDKTEKSFIYSLMFALIYSYGVNNGTFLDDSQYETILVIEEANAVLRGSANGETGENVAGQSRFEDMVDQGAGNGLFVFAVTQSCHLMPSSILNSCGLWFVGRTQSTLGHAVVLPAIGKNVRIDYKISNFLAKAPIGWFIVKTGRVFDFVDSEPTYVLVEPVMAQKIDDRGLKMLEEHKKVGVMRGKMREYGIAR